VHGSWYTYRVFLLLFPYAADFSHQKPASGGTSRDVFRVHGHDKHYTCRVGAGIGE
jgi:hypothetical protein